MCKARCYSENNVIPAGSYVGPYNVRPSGDPISAMISRHQDRNPSLHDSHGMEATPIEQWNVGVMSNTLLRGLGIWGCSKLYTCPIQIPRSSVFQYRAGRLIGPHVPEGINPYHFML